MMKELKCGWETFTSLQNMLVFKRDLSSGTLLIPPFLKPWRSNYSGTIPISQTSHLNVELKNAEGIKELNSTKVKL